MIVAINYANEKYRKAQQYNTMTAYKYGADKVIEYGPTDIDEEFRRKNASIFSVKRGDGCWLWKPYIIYKTLSELTEGDYLIYSDSGAYYINSIKYLIDTMEKNRDEIMLFENFPDKAYEWTKRKVFLALGCDEEKYTHTWCLVAGFQVIRKTGRTLQFVKEWLEYCQIPELLLSDNEKTEEQNYPGFIAHRNDQSILEILSKKEFGYAYKNPSQWGVDKRNSMWLSRKSIIQNSQTRICGYPIIFILHHQGKVSLWIKIKTYVRFYSERGFDFLEWFPSIIKKVLGRK